MYTDIHVFIFLYICIYIDREKDALPLDATSRLHYFTTLHFTLLHDYTITLLHYSTLLNYEFARVKLFQSTRCGL